MEECMKLIANRFSPVGDKEAEYDLVRKALERAKLMDWVVELDEFFVTHSAIYEDEE